MTSPIEKLNDAIAEATAALAESREPPPELESLRGLAYRTRKLQRAWERPQSLGVFGPSQAGKSFLIGALLSHELGTLKVLARGSAVDFLKEINPAKGVESTGVVTRFSTGPSPAPLRSGDFYCRLLPLEVVLESLATGFLVECTSPPTDPERVERALREARLASGPPAPDLFREAWETVWHNLQKKYRDRHGYLNELRAHETLRGDAWKRGVTTVQGWLTVYSLLWGGLGYARDLERLMALLVEGLDALGHAEAVEVDLEGVRASSKGPSIIDAACLNALGTSQPKVRVHDLASGREIGVDPGVLAALIAEIRFPLEPVTGSLLDGTDILDFPGGRALRGINGFGPEELNAPNLENAIEVFKRGKLTYLFEQYALDREITALLLCSPGPTKPEAIQLQSQVERWLHIRFGARTPTDGKELDRPSLFVALTKFDMSLGALRSDNARDRWDSRVREACVDFWARSHSSWILNWGQKGRAFGNMFWIRNPYADQMLSLQPGHEDYEAIKRGYLESPSVGRFIAGAAEKWAAMEGVDQKGLPKSGVPLLASALRAKMAEDIKSQELEAEAAAIREELLGVLRALTPSKDEAEERERLEANARTLVEALQREMARSCSGAVFGELIDQLTPPIHEVEAELRAVHGLVAPMSIKTSDKVKKVLVHMLKFWVGRSADRLRSSAIELPAAHAERFAREVCQSKLILPVLGKAIFPYFSRTKLDYTLIATILQTKVCDAMLELFADRERSTPALPVRLSYSEVLEATAESAEAVDWTDVDFEEEEKETAGKEVEIVFAGNRFFKAWAEGLAPFYLKNAGGRIQAVESDPRVQSLLHALRQVEGADVGASAR